ncbi:MAG TPA: amidohydrolase family protein [Flavisolibacter sp.]|jgi:predicted TIM-barrel fold metal-dependent hydrolase|nr:amidohydrolase family protein [Flavisolibacter sp.]
MDQDQYSRRKFIKQTSLSGMGLAFTLGMPYFKTVHKHIDNKIPATDQVIDIHQHTNYLGRTDAELVAHQLAMGVTTTVLLPAGHPVDYGSTYYGLGNGLQAEATGNEACYGLANKNPKAYLFGANEVPDLPGAVAEIEKYLKLGAPIIGECKFGVECDSPEMQKIYELAQTYQVPILMHWQYKMYNRGFERFYKMLKKYPKVNFIGHSQTWWANIDKKYLNQNDLYPKAKVTAGGLTDRLLHEYPNMYGDLSAPSGLNAIQRDEDHMRAFLERHQNKLVFGSDCTDKIGAGKTCAGSQIIAGIRRLAPNREIERKILYENAKKLLKI